MAAQVRVPHPSPLLAWVGSGRIGPMIVKDLLDILICPACRKDRDAQEPLTYDESRQVLKCNRCRRAYPIKDEIPILLIDEATIEPK